MLGRLVGDVEYLLVAMYKNNSQRCWLQFSAATNNLYIISLTDVIDMYWNRGVCANTVFLHKRDEFTLCQVFRRGGLLLY